ncbi:peroxide stress protein YaaA [Leifsonia sp. NPDC080035]|uniref:Peroxide stress protein YaaA n=1 Tax=Leifsonia sp. NPDC080035 TaxID=3143936 RepID=A0AAU7GAI8_9MICO
MLILLPPSETKRTGGAGSPLALDSLRFGSLAEVRSAVLADAVALSADHDAAVRALKLGPKQAAEVDRNRELHTAPTMPALLRYTGVLYDALDAESLTDEQWRFAGETVAVQSALFGLVGAADPIPAYRLSFDSRLTPSLKRRWRAAGAAALSEHDGLILDLRSEGYAALAPLPDRAGAHYVRVLARDESGHVRALNHFNKQAKGLLARALIEAGTALPSTDALLAWAEAEGYELGPAADGGRDLELIVPEVAGAPGKLMAVLRSAR